MISCLTYRLDVQTLSSSDLVYGVIVLLYARQKERKIHNIDNANKPGLWLIILACIH